MKDKKEYLQKIYQLAKSGVGGEKENAQKILDELLKKYSMEIEEIEELDEEIINADIKTPTKVEEKILIQVVYKVTNSTEEIYEIHRGGKLVSKVTRVKCTRKQEIEIRFLYDFYRRLWFEEQEFLLSAFIQKHKIFGKRLDENGNEKVNYISEDEMNRLRRAMGAFKDESPLLQIEE